MPVGVGSIIYLSDASENVGRISEAGRVYVSQSYTRIKNHSPINVTSASGGTTLESTAIARAYLRSESGNGIMWIGGTGQDAPYSGHGFPLWGGERSPDLYVTSFSAIRVCASVSGQVVYALGFLDGTDITLANTTPEQPDIISPLLVSHSPVSGASGVALNSEITATFNETILSSTIVSGVFRLSPAHNVTVFRDLSDTTKIVMTPNVNLSGSTVYVAGITTAVSDSNGNQISGMIHWPFTTGVTPPPPDTTPPVVSGTTPVNGATNVDEDVNVVITFSEAMLSGSINSTNIFLSKTSGGSADPASYSISLSAIDNKTVTVDPTGSLDSGVIYYINVLTGVEDVAGNNLTVADRGRSFDTTYNFTEVYNVSTSTSDILNGTFKTRIGEEILAGSALIGVTPKRITMRLAKAGGPTGTATLLIRNSSDTIVSTIGTLDVSTLTISQADYTITNLNQSHALVAGDRILLEYNTSTGGDYALVYKSTSTDPFANAEYSTFQGSYTDTATRDVSWIIYS